MKFSVVFALIVAVASAGPTKPIITAEQTELQEIIAAIQSPSTDPATAAALEQMILDLLGIAPEPVAIGPAIVESPAPVETNPINPQPETPATPSAPLVQIVLNINAVSGEISGVIPSPGVRPEPVIVGPVPVPVVDNWPVVEPVAPVEVSPVQVVDVAPVPIEPVIIATPVIPAPAVTLPEPLN